MAKAMKDPNNPLDLNTITVSPRRHPSFIQHNNRQNGVIANCIKEGWHIDIACQEDDGGTNREAAKLIIKFNDKVWAGTIQDFFAIQNIAKNALSEVKDYSSAGFTEIADGIEVESTIIELESLLSHFK